MRSSIRGIISVWVAHFSYDSGGVARGGISVWGSYRHCLSLVAQRQSPVLLLKKVVQLWGWVYQRWVYHIWVYLIERVYVLSGCVTDQDIREKTPPTARPTPPLYILLARRRFARSQSTDRGHCKEPAKKIVEWQEVVVSVYSVCKGSLGSLSSPSPCLCMMRTLKYCATTPG